MASSELMMSLICLYERMQTANVSIGQIPWSVISKKSLLVYRYELKYPGESVKSRSSLTDNIL